MLSFPPTLILRHRKESLKKCSLHGLEDREDLCFYTYPWQGPKPDLSQYVVLTLDAPCLQREDAEKGLFLIDGTWRYAKKMFATLPQPFTLRSLPAHFSTAYPRKQDDCEDPSRGLASVEALYLAYQILGRNCEGLLEYYYWKEAFLSQMEV